jgi:hypothetical protein
MYSLASLPMCTSLAASFTSLAASKKRNKKYLKIFTFFSFTRDGKGFKEVATEGR